MPNAFAALGEGTSASLPSISIYSAIRGGNSEKRERNIRPSGAHKPGKADDLSLFHLKRDVLKCFLPPQPGNPKHDLTGCVPVGPGKSVLHVPADHPRNQDIVRYRFNR